MNEKPEKDAVGAEEVLRESTENTVDTQQETVDEAEKSGEKSRELYEWVQAMLWAVLPVVLLFTFVIRMIGVDGSSMVPSLQDGDRLLVLDSALCGGFEYGDIVVLHKEVFHGAPVVKRVIAVEGQTVDIDFSAGHVFVDGVLLTENYIAEPTTTNKGTQFPLTVDKGHVFVMGDNRNRSDDSRNPLLGQVDTRYILGKAVFLAFPGEDSVTEERDFSRIGIIGEVE